MPPSVREVLQRIDAHVTRPAPNLEALWRGVVIRTRDESDAEADRILRLVGELDGLPNPVAVAQIQLKRMTDVSSAPIFVPMITRREAAAIRELGGDSFLVYFDRDASAMTVLGMDAFGRDVRVEHHLPAVTIDAHAGSAGRRSAAAVAPAGVIASDAARIAKRARIRRLLRCCRCAARSELADVSDGLACVGCGATYPVVDGVPILFRDSRQVAEQDPKAISSNSYSQQALALFAEFANGLVLDCGSGQPLESLAHVVNVEVSPYANVDVVANSDALPFAPEAFDAVVSESVLEHVPDPWKTAEEFARVLRRGGAIFVDAPFLAPFHAYPNHFCNFTQSGLDQLLGKQFEKVDGGIHPHHEPWVAIGWILRLLREGLPNDEVRRDLDAARVTDLLEAVARGSPPRTMHPLDDATRRSLAAGFFFYGRKP